MHKRAHAHDLCVVRGRAQNLPRVPARRQVLQACVVLEEHIRPRCRGLRIRLFRVARARVLYGDFRGVRDVHGLLHRMSGLLLHVSWNGIIRYILTDERYL